MLNPISESEVLKEPHPEAEEIHYESYRCSFSTMLHA